ncbi:MAG TPA: hypothetical protein PLN95_03070 [Candidatus Saccharibacteria bacterium]|nr:hypothetical protein [Candidatus Saccharibacteria bacterium]
MLNPPLTERGSTLQGGQKIWSRRGENEAERARMAVVGDHDLIPEKLKLASRVFGDVAVVAFRPSGGFVEITRIDGVSGDECIHRALLDKPTDVIDEPQDKP